MKPAVRTTCWALAALTATLVHNRLWATPNLAFFTTIAEHPTSNPFPAGVDGDYLLTSQSLPRLANLIGWTEPHEYVRLHLLVLFGGLAAVAALIHRRFGPRTAAVMLVLVALSPAMTTTLEWLGQPDALTLPLALLLVALGPRWALIAAAAVLAITHPEQAVFIALTASASRAALARPASLRDAAVATVREIPALLGGVLAGRLATEIYLRINDMTISRPRSSFLDLGLDGFIDHHTGSGIWLPIGLWGLLWLVIAAVAIARRDERDHAGWATLGIIAAAAVVPMLITLDETRVYAMVTAPLLVAAAVLLADEMPRIGSVDLVSARVGAGLLVVAAVPAMFTAGDVYWSTDLPAGEFVDFLADGEHPDELTEWLLGPFGFEIPEVSGS